VFEGPEYASYIALCRGLRLEHRIMAGDCCIWAKGDDRQPGIWWGMSPEPGLWIWLPRLDQWLAMLEEAGVQWVSFAPTPQWTAAWTDADAWLKDAEAPTREEAAARLWMAVTGWTSRP